MFPIAGLGEISIRITFHIHESCILRTKSTEKRRVNIRPKMTHKKYMG